MNTTKKGPAVAEPNTQNKKDWNTIKMSRNTVCHYWCAPSKKGIHNDLTPKVGSKTKPPKVKIQEKHPISEVH